MNHNKLFKSDSQRVIFLLFVLFSFKGGIRQGDVHCSFVL